VRTVQQTDKELWKRGRKTEILKVTYERKKDTGRWGERHSDGKRERQEEEKRK
jgi:hypothetical protein